MHSIILAALLVVDMAAPRLAFVNQTEIAAACSGRSDQACTIFREVTLQCSCVNKGGVWRLQADTHAVPYVYMTSVSFVRHEALHIGDMQMSFDAYVRELDARTFSSHEECIAHARGVVAKFPDAVREFQRTTIRLRDGRPLD